MNTQLISPLSYPPLPPRRRGGQPSNRNAFKHGLYAIRNASPLTRLEYSLKVSQPGQEIIPEVLEGFIPLLRIQIAHMFASPPQGSDLRSILAWHRPINRLLGFFLRVKKILARYRQPLLHLQLVAAHALDLIHYDFFTSGITRDTDSFREKNKKRYFNSFQEDLLPHSSASFLTSRQWALLYPLLPSTNFESGRERGRPPANLLRLLDAVFWKIAHHARWQDLPPGSPPILTCRRFYRRLFLNGRLFTLYSALYQDFLYRANADLTALVNQGCFTISGNTLILRTGLDETWQTRTALLFMQLAFQVSCRIIREKKQQNHLSFPRFR